MLIKRYLKLCSIYSRVVFFKKCLQKRTLILYGPGREETGKDPQADPLPASRQLSGTLTAVREPPPYPRERGGQGVPAGFAFVAACSLLAALRYLPEQGRKK